MDKKIKVCLIGAGRIGLFLEADKKRLKPASHFGMWMKEKQINLSAICDKNFDSFLFAKKFKKNIKFYKNINLLLAKEKPDIVSICTWKNTHYSITKKCIDFGVKTIVLEKPLATKISDGKKLINLAKKHSVKIIVNHRRRFDKEIIQLRKKINNGIIGEIKKVNCSYVYGIQATGTHVVDTLRMLLNNQAGEIEKVVGIKSHKKDFCSNDDVNLDAVLIFQNGLTCSIQVMNIKDYDIFDFHIFGSKGKILISGIGRDIYQYKIVNSKEHSGFKELNPKFIKLCRSSPRPQFKMLAQNAMDCFKKKSNPLCDEVDSYKALCVLNALIKSANNNSRKIKVKF